MDASPFQRSHFGDQLGRNVTEAATGTTGIDDLLHTLASRFSY